MDVLKSPEFAEYVKNTIERYHVPGVAIAVVQGEHIESAGFGKASLDPPEDCTPDTLFDIASTSKSLTAASVALLVDDNEKHPQIQYDARMADLLPGDFVMPMDEHEDVTLEDILSHRTGMAPNEYSLMGPNAVQPDDAQSVTRSLRHLVTIAPNRSEYLYCNLMYTAASYLVEQKSGLSFSDFLHANFFQPLRMKSTYLQPHAARSDGLSHLLATGYFWNKRGNKYTPIPCHDSPEAQGAGRIISSANDYIRWVRALMNCNDPVTKSMYEGMIKKRISQLPPGESGDDENDHEPPQAFAGAGVEILQYNGHVMVSHDGLDLGFGATHFFMPEQKFGAVIFGNSNNASNVARMIKYKLADWVTAGIEKRYSSLLEGVSSSESDDEEDEADEEDEEDEDDFTDLENEMIDELCADGGVRSDQTMALSAYTGEYWHEGYKGIKVTQKQGRLFVDARDRSVRFTLEFMHICDQRKYIAYMVEMSEQDVRAPVKAEFVLEGEKAVQLGLTLEATWDGYIWFKRVDAADV
ncbi:hypothetical protein H105_07827 [Trichophyton soudanense CBS 452.61]|uniref:Beta-lactamase-related domain-containing protein n=1 Tax=Trichophyton soudanense CBS 452.61 TaxID=1215331 RepID=A0A022XHC6_TRISD|nr:hypothetical protein H105_07827 [Trichophyton soudanense CBS 452.61]